MNLNKIDYSYIQGLVAKKVPEDKKTEYKLQLNFISKGDKKEFLADVSSFANTQGGTIFYGLSEEKSIPVSIEGILIDNRDTLLLQLESCIRNGVEPRISDININTIELDSQHSVLVISIPESVDGPHQVTLDKSNKFYARSANGKFPMDVYQVEKAMQLKSDRISEITRFQKEKLYSICNGHTPVELMPYPKVIMQLIPLHSVFPDAKYDINSTDLNTQGLPPLGGGNRTPSFNSDGILIDTQLPGNALSAAYLQVYKSGILETLNALILRSNPPGTLYIKQLEGYVIRELTIYLDYYRKLNVEGPIFLFLTLFGIEGFTIFTEKYQSFFRKPAMNQNQIQIKLKITNINCDVQELLRESFDSIWNAFGYPKSLHFNEQGKWLYDIRCI